jgi:hypothetical protein
MTTHTLKNINAVSNANKVVKDIRVSIKQQTVPLLPHERDQSTHNQTSPIRTVIKQAAKDIARGIKDTDRGEEANRVYQKLKSKP